MSTIHERRKLSARLLASAFLAIPVAIATGCAANPSESAADEPTESVVAGLIGTWSCASSVAESADVVTADVIITGNSIALNPGEGFGDPMTVNFVPSTDRWTFDGGNYVEVPAVMPDVGQPLEMRLLDQAGAFAGASFTITTQAIDSATVAQVVPDRKITYNCQRE